MRRPSLAELAQVLLGRLVLRRLERREAAPAQAEAFVVRLDHLGDPRRGGQRLLVPRHRGIHLLGAAQIELVGLEPHPGRVVDRLAGVDAEQDVVRGGVLAGQVVGVAGRHHGQAHPPRDVDAPSAHSFWIGTPLSWISTKKFSSPKIFWYQAQSRSASAVLPWRM